MDRLAGDIGGFVGFERRIDGNYRRDEEIGVMQKCRDYLSRLFNRGSTQESQRVFRSYADRLGVNFDGVEQRYIPEFERLCYEIGPVYIRYANAQRVLNLGVERFQELSEGWEDAGNDHKNKRHDLVSTLCNRQTVRDAYMRMYQLDRIVLMRSVRSHLDDAAREVFVRNFPDTLPTVL
ncbi:hypothetical protein K0U07_04940 [bacterium]|nr:hypothetical protein [bacterium]